MGGISESLRCEMAPTGVLRAGINLGNPVIAQRDAQGGDPRGVGPALAALLAKQLDIPVRYIVFETAGKLADAVKEKAWDVAFLAIDPARAVDIEFTAPYVHIEGTYLVAEQSPLRALVDFDRAGIKIAVGQKTAYDLFLSRELKHAQIIRAESSQAAVALYLRGGIDAVAGVRQPLVAVAAEHHGFRVIDGSFMVIRQAAGVPRGRPMSAHYLSDFIEAAKASGFVARALRESGVSDVTVAPARAA